MPLFSKSQPALPKLEKILDANQRIYFISDLHLGDGTRSDIFMSKDLNLMRLLEQIRLENAHLVIVGDAMDFHQAWTFKRIIAAHPRLIRRLVDLAQDTGVTYIWGNHDSDLSIFRDVLYFNVCSSLIIGEKIKVVHGYEYDPFIGENLNKAHIATTFHHLVERLLDTWIRPPIENFYTFEGRLAMWCFHKLALAVRTKNRIFDKIGLGKFKGRTAEYLQYWAMNQIADPSGIFEPIRADLEAEDGAYDMIISGHSHLPGNVLLPNGKRYVNTGSWTFGSSQYAIWDGKEIQVFDWLKGIEYTDQAYQHLMNRRYRHMDIFRWWRENYMGWLRYRVGEKGRVVQPQKPLISPSNGEKKDARTRETIQNSLDGGSTSMLDRSAETTSSISDSET
jgi:UDP-2,3-diacylglucosamine hydrolase